MSSQWNRPAQGAFGILWLALVAVLAVGSPAAVQAASTWYVGPSGTNDTAPGRGSSAADPWRTIDFAVQNVTDDTPTLIVLDGTYADQPADLSRVFATSLTIRAQTPYRAILTNTGGQPVLRSFGGANYTIEGLVIGPTQSVLAVHIGDQSANFTFRNNIFRDSYNNDLLKVNDRATNVLVEGNVFYNAGENDEALDINAANNVTVQDNIFFSDYAGSGRPAPTGGVEGNHVVVKNSPCQTTPSFCNNWAKNVTIRRNVFLNWEGPSAAGFIGLGEDGTPAYEAQDVVIENNLLIGNSTTTIEAPLIVTASKNVTVRNNTVTGDLPSLAYVMHLDAGGYLTESVGIDNNAWSDPSGTMGNFVLGDAPGLSLIHLERNAYWNGGAAIPQSGQGGQPGGALEPQDDPTPILQDPLLPAIGAVILPRYDEVQQEFASGQTAIRDEFVRLVTLYAVPAAGSPLIDAANPAYASTEDILGQPRAGQGTGPDVGAYETQTGPPPPNQPPVLDPVGDRAVTAGQLLTFTVSATDPDSDPLTYSASGLPAGATFTPATRTFQWTPALNQDGIYPGAVFTVSDGEDTDDETITITVSPADGFEESGGQVVMEAEHYDAMTARGGKSWETETSKSGFSADGYVIAKPNTGSAINSGYVTTSPDVVFNVVFSTPGTYYVWVRGQADSGNDDSLHAGIDGTGPASADRMDGYNSSSWVWKNKTLDNAPSTLVISTPGLHTIHLWMREDGQRVDKLLLRTSSSSTAPSGSGPAESPRTTPPAPDTTPPVITAVTVTDTTDTTATITWTTDEPATSQVEYGPDTNYGQATPVDAALVTSHSVTLTGLADETLHHFRVLSRDGSDNGEASADGTFTTDVTPPPPTEEFAFQESAGQVVMEAEHYDAMTPRNGKDWQTGTSKSGFAGDGYVEALPNTGSAITTGYVTTSPEVAFNVLFSSTGTYYVWVRGSGPTGSDDSLHAGIDGTGPSTADKMDGYTTTGWVWKRNTMDGAPATLVISTPGLHTIHLWMREDGLRVDKLLLRKSSSSSAPSGSGPAESPRVDLGGSDVTPPAFSSVSAAVVTPTTATITWTTDEPATTQVEYGPTTGYGWLMPLEAALTTSHSMTLYGLSPSVLYHFRARSADEAGNTGVSSDGTFMTGQVSPAVLPEAAGQVVVEAEHYTSKLPRGGDDWVLGSSRTGFSGNGYLTAEPNNGTSRNSDYLTNSPQLDYQVQFATPGTYYVWVRGLADNGSDDSLHAGLDGVGTPTADRMDGFASSNWVWTRHTMDGGGLPATLDIPSTGPHTVHLWMREDGLRVDKLLLRTDASATAPQLAGPSESNNTLARVMCVGDSITRGSGDPNEFSYRDHLQALLGIGPRAFVGTYQDPTTGDPVLDVDHEGVGGNITAQVEARLPAALAAHLPTPNPSGSRVLLHIGTNDMRNDLSEPEAVDNIEDIIQMIDAHDPTVAVHVALVVPIPPPEIDIRITNFNAALLTRLQSLQAAKANLYIVDMNTAFKQNPAWGTQYIADGVHPTDLGYQVMAGQWKLSIDSAP